ncbi:MAG: hypothetical protein L0Y58_12440 [Verrucomicrobia subdivision 3 bacterium]|nr:hypothetical protein [Limisphaerales bacterium]
MSAVEKVEQSIRQLTPSELSEFSRWFEEYLAEKWDRRIAEDAAAGKLDGLAEKAIMQYQASKCSH